MVNYLISKKLLEGKYFLFSSLQRRAENEMKWNEMLIASAKIPEREGSISPSSFCLQLPVY